MKQNKSKKVRLDQGLSRQKGCEDSPLSLILSPSVLKIGKDSLRAFFEYIVKLTGCYIIVALLGFLLLKNADLKEAIAVLKLFSLVALVLVNGDIPRAIDKNKKDIRWVNYAVLAITFIILVTIAVKVMGLNVDKTNLDPILTAPFLHLYHNIYWISAFPLFAYGLLDCYIWSVRKSSGREKNAALNYFIFADLVCIFPLVALYLLIIVKKKLLISSQIDLELFVSGSMAIVLLSSSIATKAVELFLSGEED